MNTERIFERINREISKYNEIASEHPDFSFERGIGLGLSMGMENAKAIIEEELTIGQMKVEWDHPFTEEELDLIRDAEFEHTTEVTFYTKGGKTVTFVKKGE